MLIECPLSFIIFTPIYNIVSLRDDPSQTVMYWIPAYTEDCKYFDGYEQTNIDGVYASQEDGSYTINYIVTNKFIEMEKPLIRRMHDGFLSDYRAQKWETAIELATSLIKHNEEMSHYYEMMIQMPISRTSINNIQATINAIFNEERLKREPLY
jgi:hypothetical protein